MADANDKGYMDASSYAVGRAIGKMYQGLLDTGTDADVALTIVVAYVTAMAAAHEQTEEDGEDPDG